MDEFWSFAGVIALWLGVSCGFWWLHRRSVHAKQRRQMQQAVRAAAYVSDGQKTFDEIRRQPSASADATGAALTAETHALLKRIQDRSAFFDKVNVLRVDMLASFGVEDYPPLSEILHIRRDLWAASEIVLVEDLSSFGESFAEEGAYERFRADAAALLFKADAARTREEDVIDLRLSLARGEAERFVPELKDAIRLARERDRMPSFAEIVAYPVAAITALPGKIGIARAFLLEFYRYAAEIAGAIRRSEAMERGVSELRRAREELPQRLVTGFERASDAARQSASGLRRHYDFLVAAHDFQAKYEQTLRRAPQITERGRQFIARLELAEHSERLRLTSANFLIWLTRQLATGLAHFIAGLQQLHSVLIETPPGALAAALVAPTPMRGRHLPAFRSYRMALGVSGLSEPRPTLPAVAERAMAPMRKKARTSSMAGAPAKENGMRSKAPAAKTPKAPTAAKPAKAEQPTSKATAAAPLAKATPPQKQTKAERPTAGGLAAGAKSSAVKAEAKITTRPAPEETAPPTLSARDSASVRANPTAKSPAVSPAVAQPVTQVSRIAGKRGAKLAASTQSEPPPAAQIAAPGTSARPTASVASQTLDSGRQVASAWKDVTPAKDSVGFRADAEGASRNTRTAPARSDPHAAKGGGAAAVPPKPDLAAKVELEPPVDTPLAGPPRVALPPEKRRSFLDRLLGRRPAEPTIGDLLAAAWEREHAAETVDTGSETTPAETAPTLLAKLSELPAEDLPEHHEDDDDSQNGPIDEDDTEDESGDDPESLTSSVMEVQAKLAPKPPQIRSFPWLRG
jgi:hypothetical protein